MQYTKLSLRGTFSFTLHGTQSSTKYHTFQKAGKSEPLIRDHQHLQNIPSSLLRIQCTISNWLHTSSCYWVVSRSISWTRQFLGEYLRWRVEQTRSYPGWWPCTCEGTKKWRHWWRSHGLLFHRAWSTGCLRLHTDWWCSGRSNGRRGWWCLQWCNGLRGLIKIFPPNWWTIEQLSLQQREKPTSVNIPINCSTLHCEI